MAKLKRAKGQTMIKLHRKQKIEQYEPHKQPG